MKRSYRLAVLALLMACILGFGGIGMDVWPFDSFVTKSLAFTEGDYTYTVLNGEATILKYNGGGGDLTIPNMLDGYVVTGIGERAFYDCSGLTNVTIPENVTVIGYQAFYRCQSLYGVTLPDGLVRLEDSAFRYCGELQSIHIPAGVNQGEDDGCQPFLDCPKLSNVTFGANITKIPDGLFQNCGGLQTVVIPSSATAIGNFSFSQCRALLDVTIPEGVVTIGNGAFQACDALERIALPESVTDIGTYAFMGCGSLTDVSLPVGLIRLGSYAFGDCSALTSIHIPAGMNQGVVNHYSPFMDCVNLNKITFQEGITKIPNHLFDRCTGLQAVEIPSTVTAIGDFSFANCPMLKEAVMPEGMTAIGRYAFVGCTSLSGVTIPESVTTIDANAFNGCTGLTAVSLPGGLVRLGNFAFTNCSGLASINVPAGMNQGEGDRYWPFSGCESLNDVTFDTGIERIPNYLFDNCMGLQNITIPSTVKAIGDSAFKDCIQLTEVVIPDTVSAIGNDAFHNCPELTIHCGDTSQAVIYAIDNGIAIQLSGTVADSDSMVLNRAGSLYTADISETLIDGHMDIHMEYAVKPEKQSSVSRPQAVIRLPDHAVLVRDTLTAGDERITDFTYGDNLLTIPLLNMSGNVRFRVRLTASDHFLSYALLSFRQDDESKTEVIGILDVGLSHVIGSLLPQDAPEAPTLQSKTSTSVTLNGIPGAQYRMNGGPWQDGVTFTGLRPDTAYRFYARMKATETHYASLASAALTVTTDEETPGTSPEPTETPGTSPQPTETPGTSPQPTEIPSVSLQPTETPNVFPRPTVIPGGSSNGMEPPATTDRGSLPMAAIPTVNKPAKTYTGNVKVKLLCGTPGATIYYTTNGSNPDVQSKSVTSGKTITIKKTTSLKIMAKAAGYQDSPIALFKYKVKTAKPGTRAVPKSKSLKRGLGVKLSAPKGVTLYYTTNGKKPSIKLKTKIKPGKSKRITINKNAVVKVVAKKSGCQASAVVTRRYKVK